MRPAAAAPNRFGFRGRSSAHIACGRAGILLYRKRWVGSEAFSMTPHAPPARKAWRAVHQGLVGRGSRRAREPDRAPRPSIVARSAPTRAPMSASCRRAARVGGRPPGPSLGLAMSLRAGRPSSWVSHAVARSLRAPHAAAAQRPPIASIFSQPLEFPQNPENQISKDFKGLRSPGAGVLRRTGIAQPPLPRPSEKRLQPGLRAPEDQSMHVMGAFVGVDRLEVLRVAHHVVAA